MDIVRFFVGVILFLCAAYIFQRTQSNSIKFFAVLIAIIAFYLAADGLGVLPPQYSL